MPFHSALFLPPLPQDGATCCTTGLDTHTFCRLSLPVPLPAGYKHTCRHAHTTQAWTAGRLHLKAHTSSHPLQLTFHPFPQEPPTSQTRPSRRDVEPFPDQILEPSFVWLAFWHSVYPEPLPLPRGTLPHHRFGLTHYTPPLHFLGSTSDTCTPLGTCWEGLPQAHICLHWDFWATCHTSHHTAT